MGSGGVATEGAGRLLHLILNPIQYIHVIHRIRCESILGAALAEIPQNCRILAEKSRNLAKKSLKKLT